jgi:hypothetical protein
MYLSLASKALLNEESQIKEHHMVGMSFTLEQDSQVVM